jgi:hypothetical protein
MITALLIAFAAVASPPEKRTTESSDVVPGVRFYPAAAATNGAFEFLVRRNADAETNSSTAATIYRLDLRSRRVEKVSDAPRGQLICSPHGDTFAVVYRPGDWFRSADTNVFIYSSNYRRASTVLLSAPPRETVVDGAVAFFAVEAGSGSSLQRYNLPEAKLKTIVMPGAARRQFEHYEQIHFVRGSTNQLHFYYNAFGQTTKAGVDYQDGVYTLSLIDGEIKWCCGLYADEDDGKFGFQTASGRFVFFEGDGAPFLGRKLAISELNSKQSKGQDPVGRKRRILTSFSGLSLGTYVLSQISPDGRFVLIRHQQSSGKRSKMQSGWSNTYYVVNTGTGESDIVLRDTVERDTDGSMSAVAWTW